MTKKNYESYQDLMKRFRASERERVEKALDKLEEKIDEDLMLENIKEASLILAHLLDANVKTITLLLNFMESSWISLEDLNLVLEDFKKNNKGDLWWEKELRLLRSMLDFIEVIREETIVE